eukprot:scaffold55_cov225-Ochromonas_danica.AAC.1
MEDHSAESSLQTGVATRGDVGDADSLCRTGPVSSLKEEVRQLSFPLDSTGHSTNVSGVVRLGGDLEECHSHVCPVAMSSDPLATAFSSQ